MKYFVEGLTKRQIEVFEQIAIGNDSGVPIKLADKLIAKGLIERYEQTVGLDCLGAIKVFRYSVPIPVHMEWCEWCSENYKE